MATSKIKANYEVDQTAGKTVQLQYSEIPLVHDTIRYVGFVPFPFMTKNTSYSVAFVTAAQGNVGPVTPTITRKTQNGFAFRIDGSFDYYKCSAVFDINITFA